MTAAARILTLTALLIAATSAAPARAAAWPINILNGLELNGLTTSNGIYFNGVNLNALSSDEGRHGVAVNGAGVNGIKTQNGVEMNGLHSGNGVQLNALNVNGVELNALNLNGVSANARFQGRSARPLGDVGAAGTK